MSKFKKILLIYAGVLILIIAAADVFVWIKLDAYENQLQSDEASGSKDGTQAPSVYSTPNLTPAPTPGMTQTPSITPRPSPTEIPKRTYVVEAPDNVSVFVNGEKADRESVKPESIETGEFTVLYSFSETYSEYSDIRNRVTVPEMLRYEFEAPEKSVISAKNVLGDDVVLEASEQSDGIIKYSCGFLSDDSQYDKVTALAFEAMEKYALFCTGDGEASALAPYFPADSEYLSVISKMDNSWYMKHPEPPTFSAQTVLAYKGYSESLVYVKVTMKQTLFQSNINADKTTEITHPMWFVKLDGEWKIAAIEF